MAIPDYLTELPTQRASERVEVEESPKSLHALIIQTRRDVFTLSSGELVFTYPSQITSDEFLDVLEWFEIMKRKLQRALINDAK